MGTVNYFTSDYITIGLRPYDSTDFEKDTELMGCLRNEIDQYGGSIEDALDSYIQRCYEDDYGNIEMLLKRYSFTYYRISIEPGYYEGFSICIENNFPYAFDNWDEKRSVQKEITKVKQFLLECAGCGLVECFPGWCTGYRDYKTTILDIEKAIKLMREEVKDTPTFAQYQYFKKRGE